MVVFLFTAHCWSKAPCPGEGKALYLHQSIRPEGRKGEGERTLEEADQWQEMWASTVFVWNCTVFECQTKWKISFSVTHQCLGTGHGNLLGLAWEEDNE